MTSRERDNQRTLMTEERQISSGELADIVGKRRDLPVFERNPSVTKVGAIPMRRKQIVMAEGERTLIIGKGTGEVLGEGNALYMENKMVDRERFVKVYPDLVKKLKSLSNPARDVFEVAYMQMLTKHQVDKIEVNFYTARKHGLKMSERSFQRGVRELLQKEILYQTPSADLYFVNVSYWFNGSRVTLAESYYEDPATRSDSGLAALPGAVINNDGEER
jgi:hypothetical protein